MKNPKFVSFEELNKRFPDMTLGDLADLAFIFGVRLSVTATPTRPFDPFLNAAWKEKARNEKNIEITWPENDQLNWAF
jgi:hypothetical protein